MGNIKITILAMILLSTDLIGQDYNTAYDNAYNSPSTKDAIRYASEAVGYAIKSGETKKLADSHFLLAYYLKIDENYMDALLHYYKSLKHFRIRNDEKYISDVLRNLGVIYEENYSYRNAINFYTNAYLIKEKLGYQEELILAGTYRNLGRSYRLNEQFDSALIFNEKALEIFKVKDNKLKISVMFNEIGIILDLLGEYEQARNYFFNALAVVEGTEHEFERKAKAYSNAGMSYLLENDYQKAKDYFLRSLDIKYSNSGLDIGSIMITYNNLGDIYQIQNNNDSAKYWYKKAIKMSYPIDYLNKELKIANEQLLNIAVIENDKNAEFEYLKSLSVIKDSLLQDQQEYKRLYTFQQIQSVMYKIEKQERDIMLQKERRIKLIIYSLIGIGLLLAGLLIYRYIRKIKLFKKDALRELRQLL